MSNEIIDAFTQGVFSAIFTGILIFVISLVFGRKKREKGE